MLWTQKYQPKKTEEVANSSVKKLLEFIKNHKKQKKNAILIYGASGTGKTTAVTAIAKEKNLEIIEINASDFRNAEQINEKAGNSIKQKSLFSKEKILLVDEIDGLAGNEDRGGVSALVGLIKKTKVPIICTANNPWERKLSTLRSVCTLIQWENPSNIEITKILNNIIKKENINSEESIIKSIARRSGGDIRAAITDLQVLTQSKQLNKEGLDSIDDRAKTETMFNSLIKILKNSDPKIALTALENVEEDLNTSILWIEENLPTEYKEKELAEAFEKLSRADVFLGRIRRRQHWRFMAYAHDLTTAGIAVSKKTAKKGFTKYQPPKRILKYWMAKKNKELRRGIAQKIAKITHCSEKKANKIIPYIKLIYEKNKEIHKLELNNEEIEWLKKK
jgi:replication factor C large subunit